MASWPWWWNAQPFGVVDNLAPTNIKATILLMGWYGGQIGEYSYSEYKRPHIGKAIDNADLRAGGICAITGCTAPASRMKYVGSQRIIDTVEP